MRGAVSAVDRFCDFLKIEATRSDVMDMIRKCIGIAMSDASKEGGSVKECDEANKATLLLLAKWMERYEVWNMWRIVLQNRSRVAKWRTSFFF